MHGIDLPKLDELRKRLNLSLVDDPENPEVDSALSRYLDEYPTFGSDSRTEREILEAAFPGQLQKVFTKEEILKLWFTQQLWCVQRHLDDNRDKAVGVVGKIHNSLWRNGYKQDWNQLVRVLQSLPKFHLPGLPEEFDLCLDWTTGCNDIGRCTFHRTEQQDLPPECFPFLDGTMGFFLYYKGKPVAVIGFAPTKWGVALTQVQLLKKKGNRWMYKLPRPLFQMAVAGMYHTFKDCGVYLVDGASNVQSIRQSYGPRACDFDKKGAAARIQSFYDQELDGFVRGEERTIVGTLYRKIQISCNNRSGGQ